MEMGWELKQLRERSLTAAVDLAKHYRALNQPEDAESICRDILDVAPDDEEAWRTLGLALTDQFPTSWMTLFDDACAAFAKLSSAYERVYYTAIAWERYAKAQLVAGRARNAVHAFEEAIGRFEQADELGPAGRSGVDPPLQPVRPCAHDGPGARPPVRPFLRARLRVRGLSPQRRIFTVGVAPVNSARTVT